MSCVELEVQFIKKNLQIPYRIVMDYMYNCIRYQCL